MPWNCRQTLGAIACTVPKTSEERVPFTSQRSGALPLPSGSRLWGQTRIRVTDDPECNAPLRGDAHRSKWLRSIRPKRASEMRQAALVRRADSVCLTTGCETVGYTSPNALRPVGSPASVLVQCDPPLPGAMVHLYEHVVDFPRHDGFDHVVGRQVSRKIRAEVRRATRYGR